jgi:AcrR family transcriptional regulator
MTSTNTRRRGAALEDAILDAAWDELIEHGYASMMLESVAKRAGTSRPVLARRWPTRTKLATAALARHYKLNPVSVPDMGSVRDELHLALRSMSNRLRPNLAQLVFDMSRDLADEGSNLRDVRAQLTDGALLRTILERGVDRGEIDSALLTPRIVALPTDLARHEMLMTLRPLTDRAICEIVDEVFLPLVRREPENKSGNSARRQQGKAMARGLPYFPIITHRGGFPDGS